MYPFHLIKSFFTCTLTKNPYISDGIIWLPIWGATRRLTDAAQQDPNTGFQFLWFLQEYRPLQTTLAMYIAHAATAGCWQQDPLNDEMLTPSPLIEEAKKLHPSQSWLQALENLKNQLIAYGQISEITQRQQQFADFVQQLKHFQQLTLDKPYRWHRYYLPAINHWLQEAEKKQEKLAKEAETTQPITRNVYLTGTALGPVHDEAIFFGRETLKSDFSRQVLSAREMPMFLIYGHRRVGKTSLLRFLPSLLGSRFKLVYQDSERIETLQV